MPLLRRFGGLFLLLSLLGLASPPLRAQVAASQEIALLKAALRPPAATLPTADSLLAEARRLGYAPGQVVALAQLASLRLQA